MQQELIQDAKDGDGIAFDALLGPLLDPAYRLALGILHDREAAQDAVQDAALRAWRKLEQLREGTEMRPWFLAIVANQCRSMLRTRWWRVVKLPTLGDGRSEAPVLDAEAGRLRELRGPPACRTRPLGHGCTARSAGCGRCSKKTR